MFSSCEGDRRECQECTSVVIVLCTCQYAVYKYMIVCMINNNSCMLNQRGVVKGWASCGRSRKTASSDDGFSLTSHAL